MSTSDRNGVDYGKAIHKTNFQIKRILRKREPELKNQKEGVVLIQLTRSLYMADSCIYKNARETTKMHV